MIQIEQIKEWPYHIGGGYWVEQDGTLYYRTVSVDTNGGATDQISEPIANFTPILKEQRMIDNGIETNESSTLINYYSFLYLAVACSIMLRY